jgi:DNA polymerase III alpha subunit
MIYDTKTKKSIAGLEMNDLESLGVVKFDILGIALLDKMMNVQSLLKGDNYVSC